jgi:Zn-dependent peptidase ImmA (M78 family)/transcriptional regulator with XRE-family HTH domain
VPRRIPLSITGSVLAWAIEQAGLSMEDVVARTGFSRDSIEAWIDDKAKPTIGQVRKLAEVVRRPMAVFYLPSPPEDVGVPPALRRTAGATQRDLTPEQLRQARRARRMQRLVHSLLASQASIGPHLPQMRPGTDSSEAGRTLRGWVGVTVASQLAWTTAKQAFDEWRFALESRGVLVLQLQLSDVLRGFSLWDELAPLVSVNTAENYQARSFTLFHELAHLVSRTESSCAGRPGRSSGSLNIERWCEEVASVALLPPDAIRSVAARARATVSDEFGLVSRVADTFKASLRATALALIREDLVERSVYDEIEERAPISDREKGFARGGGQRAPERRLSEYGNRTLSLVFSALESRRLTERDARDYLRLDGDEIYDLGAQLLRATP